MNDVHEGHDDPMRVTLQSKLKNTMRLKSHIYTHDTIPKEYYNQRRLVNKACWKDKEHDGQFQKALERWEEKMLHVGVNSIEKNMLLSE